MDSFGSWGPCKILRRRGELVEAQRKGGGNLAGSLAVCWRQPGDRLAIGWLYAKGIPLVCGKGWRSPAWLAEVARLWT